MGIIIIPDDDDVGEWKSKSSKGGIRSRNQEITELNPFLELFVSLAHFLLAKS